MEDKIEVEGIICKNANPDLESSILLYALLLRMDTVQAFRGIPSPTPISSLWEAFWEETEELYHLCNCLRIQSYQPDSLGGLGYIIKTKFHKSRHS